MPPALFEASDGAEASAFVALPLVREEDTLAEWAAQEPLPEHGRNPYAEREYAEAAVQNEDGITGLPVPAVYAPVFAPVYASETADSYDSYVQTREAAPVANSPYGGPTVLADLSAESHNSEFYAPTSVGTLTEDRSGVTMPAGGATNGYHPEEIARTVNGSIRALGDSHQQDVAEAVSVAAAYFEDTLSTAPQRILSAGPLGAEALRRALQVTGVGGANGLQVRECVEPAALASDATSSNVPRGWLAGVMGALRG